MSNLKKNQLNQANSVGWKKTNLIFTHAPSLVEKWRNRDNQQNERSGQFASGARFWFRSFWFRSFRFRRVAVFGTTAARLNSSVKKKRNNKNKRFWSQRFLCCYLFVLTSTKKNIQLRHTSIFLELLYLYKLTLCCQT